MALISSVKDAIIDSDKNMERFMNLSAILAQGPC